VTEAFSQVSVQCENESNQQPDETVLKKPSKSQKRKVLVVFILLWKLYAVHIQGGPKK